MDSSSVPPVCPLALFEGAGTMLDEAFDGGTPPAWRCWGKYCTLYSALFLRIPEKIVVLNDQKSGKVKNYNKLLPEGICSGDF